MKLSGSAEAERRQRRNDSGGGPEGVRDSVPNKSHSRTQLKDHPKGWFFSWVKEFGE